ncbi:MAG: hypothetical protein IKN65_02905 [Clostridia bacterium]|nr:hypothetical protein [Clostridia bacterium]
MRKLGEILFIIVAIIMVTFALSTNVKAAQEDSYGYEDFDSKTTENATTTESTEQKTTTDGANKTENSDNKTATETSKDENKEQETNTPNTATTAHVKAGVFENSMFIIATAVLALSIGFGYRKLKRYNF